MVYFIISTTKKLKTNKDDILFLNDLIALNAAKKLKGIKIPIVHSDLREEYAQIADSFLKKLKYYGLKVHSI